jgi:hypothetical protein
MSAAAVKLSDVAEVTASGKLRPLFHDGQRRAYWSDASRTLILAGTQGGKSVVGPWWLLKQMQRFGPGDYIVAGPELTLLRKKVVPEIVTLFSTILGAGALISSPDLKFVISRKGRQTIFGSEHTPKTTIWFGHGDDPDSLESMTAKAAWLDEPGQKKFRRDSHEAIERRLAIADGPILYTTTPYVLHWLKTDIYDKRDDPAARVVVINFDSIANPTFPREVWERAKATLPPWKFNMFYRGRFERPAGLIYDCWSEEPGGNLIRPFAIPANWPRWVGIDFGGVNTAALKVAQELDGDGKPTGRWIGYEEYLAGGRTARQHAEAIKANEPRLPVAVGGAASEEQWRQEFAAGGMPIYPPPITDVEVGILRFYGLIKTRTFVVFETLAGFRDQMNTYSRVLDAQGERTETIEDKSAYHYLDAGRYFATLAAQGEPTAEIW